MEDIKKTQVQCVEVETTMCEMKNTMDSINGRLGIAEEKIGKLSCQSIIILEILAKMLLF